MPTVRYYEEIGLLPKPVRRSGGHRIYRDRDLRRLIFIRRCRDFGFPLEQVRALTGLADDRDCHEARDLVQLQLDAVRRKLTEFAALERTLVDLVDGCNASCSGGRVADCVVVEGLAAQKSQACCAQSKL